MKKKIIIAAFAAVFMFLMSVVSTAQIIKLDDLENQRQSVSGGLEISGLSTISEQENFSPLGSGLCVLTVSAGLYLLVKARKLRKA